MRLVVEIPLIAINILTESKMSTVESLAVTNWIDNILIQQ